MVHPWPSGTPDGLAGQQSASWSAPVLWSRGVYSDACDLAINRLERFLELIRCVREDNLTDPRDRVVLLLLAGSGVLAHGLSYSERPLAARQLRTLVRSPQRASLIPRLTGTSRRLRGGVSVLGSVDMRMTRDLVDELLEGLLSGDMATSE